MIVAELEVHHSRPIAPTRRVALGDSTLPVDPPPGYGGVLLGGVVAHFLPGVDPDLHPELGRLTVQLEEGRRIHQPRLRHRLQEDRVGLQRSTHRLVQHDGGLAYDLDDEHGHPAQQVLGAVYAAGRLPRHQRAAVLSTVRRAMAWTGPIGPELIAALVGFGPAPSVDGAAVADPVGWARQVLGIDDVGVGDDIGPSRREVQRRFRAALLEVHPDHGNVTEGAAARIAELSEARRILLG